MENFIYSVEQAMTSELCNSFISQIANVPESKGYVDTAYGKRDDIVKCTDITLRYDFINYPGWDSIIQPLYDTIERHKDLYVEKYEGMKAVTDLKVTDSCVLVRYKPGQGFPNYYCERGTPQNKNRVLSWILYLNEVTDGGGTEFFYQTKIEHAKQGKLIIWPAEWTHLHRGIVSNTQTKYIITGWIEFK